MEAHLTEGLALLLRWAHFITGIAWIGASFWFNWLENHLQRVDDAHRAGSLWAVHGGGFYFLEKHKIPKGGLPSPLHWFKWEAYATWLTGMALLVVVYYANAAVFMSSGNPDARFGPGGNVLIGICSLLISWFAYDAWCRLTRDKPKLTALGCFLGLVILTVVLCALLPGRAAYIHVGAAIGTLMVGNVFRIIIPAQKELVAALNEGRDVDTRPGQYALQRSRHNNYLTLPVLFIMISNHYPAAWAHPWNAAILIAIALGGAGVRHWFNIRHLPGRHLPVLVIALALLVATWLLIAPEADSPAPTGETNRANVSDSTVMAIVETHCANCHSASPTFGGFGAAPLGIELDSIEQVEHEAARLYQSVVVSRMMPLGNLTSMTEEQRETIAQWYFQTLETE